MHVFLFHQIILVSEAFTSSSGRHRRMVKRVFHKYLDALLAPDIAYDHPHHRSSVAVTQEFGLHHDRIPPGRGWIQLVLVTTRAVVAVNGTLSFQKVGIGGH